MVLQCEPLQVLSTHSPAHLITFERHRNVAWSHCHSNPLNSMLQELPEKERGTSWGTCEEQFCGRWGFLSVTQGTGRRGTIDGCWTTQKQLNTFSKAMSQGWVNLTQDNQALGGALTFTELVLPVHANHMGYSAAKSNLYLRERHRKTSHDRALITRGREFWLTWCTNLVWVPLSPLLLFPCFAIALPNMSCRTLTFWRSLKRKNNLSYNIIECPDHDLHLDWCGELSCMIWWYVCWRWCNDIRKGAVECTAYHSVLYHTLLSQHYHFFIMIVIVIIIATILLLLIVSFNIYIYIYIWYRCVCVSPSMNICNVAQMCSYMDDLLASQGNTFGGQIMHWMVPWWYHDQSAAVNLVWWCVMFSRRYQSSPWQV